VKDSRGAETQKGDPTLAIVTVPYLFVDRMLIYVDINVNNICLTPSHNIG